MPDRVVTVPAMGEAFQATITNASTGNATAGAVVLVIPDGMTNAQLMRGLRLLLDRARRDPNQISGV